MQKIDFKIFRNFGPTVALINGSYCVTINSDLSSSSPPVHFFYLLLSWKILNKSCFTALFAAFHLYIALVALVLVVNNCAHWKWLIKEAAFQIENFGPLNCESLKQGACDKIFILARNEEKFSVFLLSFCSFHLSFPISFFIIPHVLTECLHHSMFFWKHSHPPCSPTNEF